MLHAMIKWFKRNMKPTRPTATVGDWRLKNISSRRMSLAGHWSLKLSPLTFQLENSEQLQAQSVTKHFAYCLLFCVFVFLSRESNRRCCNGLA